MAFIFPDISSVFCMSSFCLKYSYVALMIIPFLIFLYYIINKNFIKFFDKTEQMSYEKEKIKQRKIFLASRSLIFLLVLIAISGPFIMESTTIKGNPRVTILVDSSKSMELFEKGLGEELASGLENKLPVSLRNVITGDQSAIGDSILNNLERDENVLVITDGNSNKGKLLGDVMLLANSLNATVSTLDIEPIEKDVGVEIIGPRESIINTEEIFTINVNVVGDKSDYTLEVKFDDELMIAETNDKSKVFTFTKNLPGGYHKITAVLTGLRDDFFEENNKFYKSIKVVPRPRVLFVSEKASPLQNDLENIYDLNTLNSIPSDLNEYMAIILNDLPANKILPSMNSLSDFVSDGNGLFVIGGQSSYDRGGYKGTFIETLLPVRVGAGEESEKSDVQIIVVIDISHGTEDYVDIEKAQAVSIINSLDEKNNVGVIAFSSVPYKVADIRPLKDNKKELIDKISRLVFDGQSYFNLGIDSANKVLRSVSGSKNIILITDGKTTYYKLMDDTREAARQAAARGVKVYVAGVGENRNDNFLSEVARIGEGIYFPVDSSNKLKILFGESESKEDQDFANKLVMLDTTHFITYNQSLDAVVSGYNYVIPKPASRLLITTNKNIPVMVSWRFGLGRVISMATDDGGKWGGELLSKTNSKIMTKTINWVIGDLSRKKEFDVTMRDTTLDNDLHISVVSGKLPKHEQLNFIKSDVNLYSANFKPDKTGFYNFLEADSAVNYRKEYLDLGVDETFLDMVKQTGGEVFNKDDIDQIIEFAKENSKRIRVNTREILWPFLILAIIIFLTEIWIRRQWELKNYN
jgi:uncharacterized membrane protein